MSPLGRLVCLCDAVLIDENRYRTGTALRHGHAEYAVYAGFFHAEFSRTELFVDFFQNPRVLVNKIIRPEKLEKSILSNSKKLRGFRKNILCNKKPRNEIKK